MILSWQSLIVVAQAVKNHSKSLKNSASCSRVSYVLLVQIKLDLWRFLIKPKWLFRDFF